MIQEIIESQYLIPGLGDKGITSPKTFFATGETGVRLAEVTPATLVEALHSLLSHPAEARRMGGRAHRLITRDVTLHEFATRVIRSVLIAAGKEASGAGRGR